MKSGNALHIYFGECKGKTTAAMGLAIRAAGQKRKVLISQFMKTNTSGELNILNHIDNIKIVYGSPIQKLTTQMTPEELAAERVRQKENFDLICRSIAEWEPELIVLDELLVAEKMGFVEADTIIARIDDWLDYAEVVLTGRWCCERLMEKADYATEMVKHKHPFDQGVMARKGIEY
ncbi:MAG: cob(I)yrinic acid a,c-diamide adenosyltransferase [Clostridia bacterium]|nr:cob(I)yrinic acid a,c-diamide adenosyltransferase [Clostridia bacterium]